MRCPSRNAGSVGGAVGEVNKTIIKQSRSGRTALKIPLIAESSRVDNLHKTTSG